jgi:hypothetical protein
MNIIESVSLTIDTLEFTTTSNKIVYRGLDHLFFKYDNNRSVALVNVSLVTDSLQIELLPSNDFFIIDGLSCTNNNCSFKVRFNNLEQSDFLKFSFRINGMDLVLLEEINLLPVTTTYAEVYLREDEIYVGEEVSFEVITNHPTNLLLDYRWKDYGATQVRFSERGGQVFIHLLPRDLGQQKIRIPLPLKNPEIDTLGNLINSLPPLELDFTAKGSRLTFLQFDKSEITPNEDPKEAITIQLDNHRSLEMNKTYRIEDQEEIGGPLVAELFTRSRLSNDRILCEVRVYAYHRKSEGFLFIKDGDRPRFITNIDITPQTQIQNILIQRNGGDWVESNIVYPGERIALRLEGEGFQKSAFSFQGTSDLRFDSLVRNEKVSVFEMSIPEDIPGTKSDI